MTQTTLLPCPFCGEHPYPIQIGATGDCRYLECKCNVYMYRHRCFIDDAHSRQETDDEIDANLIKRWNRRAA